MRVVRRRGGEGREVEERERERREGEGKNERPYAPLSQIPGYGTVVAADCRTERKLVSLLKRVLYRT